MPIKGRKMGILEKLKNHGINFICWLVKTASAAILILVVAIAIGEGPPNPLNLPARQLAMLILFCIALIGLALASWKQQVGGIVILPAMIGFYIANGKFSTGWIFATITVLGLLNIICPQLKK